MLKRVLSLILVRGRRAWLVVVFFLFFYFSGWFVFFPLFRVKLFCGVCF